MTRIKVSRYIWSNIFLIDFGRKHCIQLSRYLIVDMHSFQHLFQSSFLHSWHNCTHFMISKPLDIIESLLGGRQSHWEKREAIEYHTFIILPSYRFNKSIRTIFNCKVRLVKASSPSLLIPIERSQWLLVFSFFEMRCSDVCCVENIMH